MHAPLVRRLAAITAVLALAAFVAAGCGATKQGAAEAAVDAKGLDYVTSKALFYIVIDTDFEGENWKQFDEHGKKFEGYTEGKAKFLEEFSSDEDVDYDKDIKPWLGDSAGIAALDLEGGPDEDGLFLGWVETKDAKKAEAYIKETSDIKDESKVKGVTVYESVGKESEDDEPMFWCIKDDVLLISNTKEAIEQALETADGGESITESDDVKDVAGEVGDDTLVAFVMSGDGLRDAIEAGARDSGNEEGAEAITGLKQVEALRGVSVGLEVEENGARLHGYAGYDKDKLGDTDLGKSAKPELIEDLPESTILAFGGEDLGGRIEDVVDSLGDASPDVEQGIAQAEAGLGVEVKDLAEAYSGQFALAVGEPEGEASPVPPVSLVFEANDETGDVTDKLMGATALQTGTPPKDVEVGGVDGKEANLGAATVTSATTDDHTIITTDADLIENFGDGDTLADNDAYKDVRKAADAPDEVAALLFIDTQALLEAAESIGQGADADTDALGAVLAWADADDDSQTFDLFVEITDGGGGDDGES